MSKEVYGLHWFRRDLRVAGNEALKKQFLIHKKKVLGIFCFDKSFLNRNDFSACRFDFFLKTLIELRKELRAIGSDLLILDVGPEQAFAQLFKKLKDNKLPLPSLLSWSRDYEPFAKARDQRMEKFLKDLKIDCFAERDHLLIEPHELSKDDGDAYKVYTPFSRKWLELFKMPHMQNRIKGQKNAFTYLNKLQKGEVDKIFAYSWARLFKKKISYPDHLDLYSKSNSKLVDIPIPKAGALAAYAKLKTFKKKLSKYSQERDFPAFEANSTLSMYLKNGSITVPMIISFLKLKPYLKKELSQDTFFSELIWREFYFHILDRNPLVEKEAFLGKYRSLKWENSKKLFKAWKAGKTGFPIVDAGMRELNTTGLMHNRVRMIVASFLTKDLLIDWRWGEEYFMHKLLDGDLAANNGGWQWPLQRAVTPNLILEFLTPGDKVYVSIPKVFILKSM